MQSVDSIGGDLWIDNNDVLSDISHLINLQSVGQSLRIINNSSIVTLNGLNSISANSLTSIHIYNNPLLGFCSVQSICDYLIVFNPVVEIYNNALGCNSQVEVEDLCWISVEETDAFNTFSISPNPCKSFMTLQFTISEPGSTIIEICNISAVKTKSFPIETIHPGTYRKVLDLNDLRQGIYFCTLKTRDGIQTRKIILR